mmetsp:Transcript_5672/g.17442  ORF Transcript_5672/g.17442 Transcript_5672/m.17442 type:complete len:208 (+) Transcript_5672:1699-2322(+)
MPSREEVPWLSADSSGSAMAPSATPVVTPSRVLRLVDGERSSASKVDSSAGVMMGTRPTGPSEGGDDRATQASEPPSAVGATGMATRGEARPGGHESDIWVARCAPGGGRPPMAASSSGSAHASSGVPDGWCAAAEAMHAQERPSARALGRGALSWARRGFGGGSPGRWDSSSACGFAGLRRRAGGRESGGGERRREKPMVPSGPLA